MGLTSAQAESNYGYQQRFDGDNFDLSPSNDMLKFNMATSLYAYSNYFGVSNKTHFWLISKLGVGTPYSIAFDVPRFRSLSGNGYGGYDLATIACTQEDTSEVDYTGLYLVLITQRLLRNIAVVE